MSFQLRLFLVPHGEEDNCSASDDDADGTAVVKDGPIETGTPSHVAMKSVGAPPVSAQTPCIRFNRAILDPMVWTRGGGHIAYMGVMCPQVRRRGTQLVVMAEANIVACEVERVGDRIMGRDEAL